MGQLQTVFPVPVRDICQNPEDLSTQTCVRMNDKSDENCDFKAYTHHGVDALREREKLNQSRSQVENHESGAESAGVSWSEEMEKTEDQTSATVFLCHFGEMPLQM